MTFKPPVPQRLRQYGDMDCGLSVFAELTGISREQILLDKPCAAVGLTIDQWEEYFRSKGFGVTRYQSDESYPLPCAHLVNTGSSFHWIYQSSEGVFDPSPAFQYMPADDPRMLTFSVYLRRILAICVISPKG